MPRADRATVLHLVESLASGVATALEAYMVNTPELTHVVVGGARAGYELGAGLAGCDVVEHLPQGRLAQFAHIRRAVRAYRPDVVHCHSSWAGLFGRVAARLEGVPVVYSPHGIAFLRQDVGPPVRAAFWCAEAALARITDAFAVAGPRERALVTSLRGKAEVFEATPALAVGGRGPEPEPAPVAEHDGRVVVTLGRVSPQKAPEFFAETVRELRRAGWDGEAIWVGGGERELVDRLASAGVRVTGWLTRADALRQLSAASVYLHTAAWEASVPYAVLEAASAGLPVVARRRPELADIPGAALGDTPAELASICRAALEPGPRRDDLREQARTLVSPGLRSAQRDALLAAYDAAIRAGTRPRRGPGGRRGSRRREGPPVGGRDRSVGGRDRSGVGEAR